MSYSSFVSIIRGIAISKADWGKFSDNLWEYSAANSCLIDEAAEYHNKSRAELDGDDLKEYLSDTNQLVESEFLDFFFIGIDLFTREIYGDNRFYNLAEFVGISETIEDNPIGEFIYKYYRDYPVADYLIEWTS